MPRYLQTEEQPVLGLKNILRGSEGSYSVAITEAKNAERAIEHELSTCSRLRESELEGLYHAFLNRIRFKYTLRDMLAAALKCLCLRRIDRRSRKQKDMKRHHLFEKAEKKVRMDLDAGTILRTVRRLKLLTQALLP